MSAIKLTIDDINVEVPAGVTVFWAAKKAGIEIPHLCYSEGLSPTSACRLCVVEVQGARNLSASCSLPAANNMVVRTATPRVMAARRMVIEFLLSDHPYDCMTCEKSGTCALEKYAYQLGIRKSSFEGEKHSYPVRDSNPFYERDYNKCILCGRCVTVCHEVQYCGAVDLTHRGFATKVAAFGDRSMQETHLRLLRQLRQRLPHRAPSPMKAGRFQGRDWEMKKVPTTCSYCGVGCTARPEREGRQGREGDLRQGRRHEQGLDLRQGQVRLRLHPQPRPADHPAHSGRTAAPQGRLGRGARQGGGGPQKSEGQYGPDAIGVLVLRQVHQRGELPLPENRPGRHRHE